MARVVSPNDRVHRWVDVFVYKDGRFLPVALCLTCRMCYRIPLWCLP